MAASEGAMLLAAVGRLTWMLFGPLVLVVSTYGILTNKGGWLTVADVAFFAALGGMLLGRWLEFRAGNPQKSTGEPATPEDLRRYYFVVVPAGLVLWVVANYLGNHLLTR
jgi:hypothetical protein